MNGDDIDKIIKEIARPPETVVTIKLVFIIAIFCTVIGVMFSWIFNHEGRITKTESSIKSIQADVCNMVNKLELVRQDQISYYTLREPRWRPTKPPAVVPESQGD